MVAEGLAIQTSTRSNGNSEGEESSFSDQETPRMKHGFDLEEITKKKSDIDTAQGTHPSKGGPVPVVIDEHGREIQTELEPDGKPKKLPEQSWRFAPLSVPRQRRLQTLAVFIWPMMLPLAMAVFFFIITIPPLWPLLTVYLIWVWFDDAPENGGRKVQWVRRWSLFRYFAEYFPISLIKTADLPPDRPYLFGYHPHGIIGMGAVATFATEALEFSDTFPGLEARLMTLQSNFKLPLYRELLLAMGLCSVSKKSCERALRKGKGSCIAIVVGGAAESLKAHPGVSCSRTLAWHWDSY